MLEINLLPWREQARSKKKIYQALEISLALLLSFIMLFCIHLLVNKQLQIKRGHILQLQKDLTQLNEAWEARRKAYQALDYQKSSAFNTSTIFHHQGQILYWLRKLAEWMPQSMRLEQMDFDGQNYTLQGFSFFLTDILHFAEHFNSPIQAGQFERLGKEKYLTIKKKNNLYYYQLGAEFSA